MPAEARHRRNQWNNVLTLLAVVMVVGVVTVITASMASEPARAQDAAVPQQPSMNAAVWTWGPLRLGTYQNPLSPQILVTRRNEIHVFWEDQGAIYHARRLSDGAWQAPRRVVYGTGPSVALDSRGCVHMVFAQDVSGNFEVYYTTFGQDGAGRCTGDRWSLPRNISHTSGPSYSPNLAVAPDGRLHVVWNDATPGEEVIYHATLDRNRNVWVNRPLPSAWGKVPSIHFESSHVTHVLWQGLNLYNRYDIYHMQGKEGVWQLPENISDSRFSDSVGVRAVLDYRGEVHLVWQEETERGFRVYYATSEGGGWLWPTALSAPGAMDASIATSERGRYVHVSWTYGSTLWTRWRGVETDQWSRPILLAQAYEQATQLRFAPENATRMRALWRMDTLTGAEVWYGEGPTPIVQRLRFTRMLYESPESH